MPLDENEGIYVRDMKTGKVGLSSNCARVLIYHVLCTTHQEYIVRVQGTPLLNESSWQHYLSLTTATEEQISWLTQMNITFPNKKSLKICTNRCTL